MQTLFQFDFTGKIPGRSELEESIKDRVPSKEIIAFIYDLVTGTVGHIEEIDEIIAVTSQHWQLQRLATVDRNILRAATYELLYRDDIPAAVTINEAVDIAKKFSTVDSYSFINGVLDKISGDRQNKRNADKKN